jgi:hypothetical protein
MKKSIIKRRKRVVPAFREQSPSAITQSSGGSSLSPEAQPANLAHAPDHHAKHVNGGSHPMSLAPPPVDFTGYHANSTSLPHHPAPGPRLPELESLKNGPPPRSSFGRQSTSPRPMSGTARKRSLGETENFCPLESSNQLAPIMSRTELTPPARLSSISSLLNHGAAPEERRHDTAGSGNSGSPPPSHSPHQPSSGPPDPYRLDRRAQLQREAEQMREALWAKERELAELER